MTDYTQGDILWIKYPFSDQPEKQKNRPALVISNEFCNKLDNDLIVLPITSTLRKDAFSLMLEVGDTDTALPTSCEVRCNKPLTIRNTLAIGKLTRLKSQVLKEVILKHLQSTELK